MFECGDLPEPCGDAADEIGEPEHVAERALMRTGRNGSFCQNTARGSNSAPFEALCTMLNARTVHNGSKRAVAAFAVDEPLGAVRSPVHDNGYAHRTLRPQGGIEREVPLPIGRRAVGTHALGREARDLLGEVVGRRERLPYRDNPVGESHLQRLVRTDRATGEDHVERSALADYPWQAYGAAVDQRHSPPSGEDAEGRVLLDYPQVGQQRELEPTRDGMTRDGGDDRLGELHAGRPHGPVAAARRIEVVAALEVVDRREVGARAERTPSAGQDGDVEVVVLLELAERVTQLLGHRSVHGIADVRAVEGDGADGVVDVEENVAHALIVHWATAAPNPAVPRRTPGVRASATHA